MSQPLARVSARDGRRVGHRLTARLAFSGLRRVDMLILALKSGSIARTGYSHCEFRVMMARLVDPMSTFGRVLNVL